LAQTAPKRKLSVLKRARQSEKRNLRNKSVRSEVKTHIKKFTDSLASGKKEQVEESLRLVVKKISSAASKGVLHRNTASRNISRLARKANAALKS
jgi:small subunit ribosomal protein S20